MDTAYKKTLELDKVLARAVQLCACRETKEMMQDLQPCETPEDERYALVGKPVPLMNKEDKVTAIQFLNDAGAFLITKSGDKVANYFGISKYTLYSYIDVNK